MTPQERKEAAEIAGKWVREGKLKFAPSIMGGNMTKFRALNKVMGLTAKGTPPRRARRAAQEGGNE